MAEPRARTWLQLYGSVLTHQLRSAARLYALHRLERRVRLEKT